MRKIERGLERRNWHTRPGRDGFFVRLVHVPMRPASTIHLNRNPDEAGKSCIQLSLSHVVSHWQCLGHSPEPVRFQLPADEMRGNFSYAQIRSNGRKETSISSFLQRRDRSMESR